MNAVIDQLVPPNVISFARKCQISLHGKAESVLLAVKNNLIDVFLPANDKETQKRYLKFVSRHTFAAKIEGIEVLSRSGNDLIFVSFPDCKITAFEYCSQINDFLAKSLHFFEREEYRTGPVLGTPSSLKPQLNMDPEGRMLAIRVFHSFLAFLPLSSVDSQANELDFTAGHALDKPATNNSASDSLDIHSTVVSFVQQIDPRLKNVRNFCFLPGFLNPTLAILFDLGSNSEPENMVLRSELNQSSTRHTKETCAVMIIAVEPSKSTHKSLGTGPSVYQFTVINCIENIPWDAEGLHALPKPVGGLFISCTNLLLWIDVSSSTAPYSIALNHFASKTYSHRLNNVQFQSFDVSSLLDCQFLALGADGEVLRGLFITKIGERMLISIARSGRTLGFFNAELLKNDTFSAAPSPSSIIRIDDGHIFVASEGGCSQLISLKSSQDDFTSQSRHQAPKPSKSSGKTSAAAEDDIDAYLYGNEMDVDQIGSSTSISKPLKTTGDDDYLVTLEEEEKRLKSQTSNGASGKFGTLRFEVVDCLETLGPVVDLAVGCSEAGSLELVTINGAAFNATGSFFPGSVNALTQRIAAIVSASFNLPDTRQIWTLNTGARLETRYLVASTISSTLVLTTSEAKIVELEESDFFLEGPSSHCGVVRLGHHEEVILQVFGSGFRILSLDDAKLLAELPHTYSAMTKVDSVMNGFLCLTSDGILRCFSVCKNEKFDLKEIAGNTLHSVKSFSILQGEYLFAILDSGALEIYTVGDFELVYRNDSFYRLPISLFNRKSSELPDSAASFNLNERIVAFDLLSTTANEALLFVRVESFSKGNRILSLVSYKMDLSSFSRLDRLDYTILGSVPAGDWSYGCAHLENQEIFLYSNISNMPVYCLGMTSRQRLRQHIVTAGGPVYHAIASYNDTSLMTLKADGTVSILDVNRMRRLYSMDFENGWYHRKVFLPTGNRVPTHIAYHPPSRTYLLASTAICSTFSLPVDEYASLSENPAAVSEAAEGIAPKLFAAQSNQLHLLNPTAWSFVDEYPTESFLSYEGVTCMKTLELATRQTSHGFHPFLVVGTAYQKSEDRPIRGRGLVFDVAEVVPEPGRPETNRKLRLKGITDFKGPVLCFTPLLEGNVVISLGQKVVVHAFEEDEKFAGVAFHDLGTCTLAMASLKNFFAAADLANSVSFLAFQAEPLARLHALSRDFGQRLHCGAVEFLVNREGQTMLVTSDSQGGLHFFSYAPNNLTTNAGQRLLDRGTFYLHGAPITKLARLPSRLNARDLCLLSGSTDGSIHLISPLPTVAFRRLFVLELRMAALLPASGGIAARIARQVPRRANISHALPVTGQHTVFLPTSTASGLINSTSEQVNPLNHHTIILHHLPVSNAVLDAVALRRYFSDPLVDALARQILANRFGLDFSTLMNDLESISTLNRLF